MTRLVFGRGEQRGFILDVEQRLGVGVEMVARVVGISRRSMSDWKNEKTLGSEVGLKKLSKVSGVKLPIVIEKREEYWNARKFARKGALKRLEIHGPPGTPEGRRKGGLVSQWRRREKPELYSEIGVNFRKNHIYPLKSLELAEFVGILLGDGGITKDQIRVTLNAVADKDYVGYVANLMGHLLGQGSYIYPVKGAQAVTLMFTSVGLVEYLVDLGLKVGDKVKQQVGVPKWVRGNLAYSKCCVRGLMDTDGGIFEHRYQVAGKRYSYLKINFSNRSMPLRQFVYSVLLESGLTPKMAVGKHVWLYSEPEVYKYMEVIGSSNERLLRKIR